MSIISSSQSVPDLKFCAFWLLALSMSFLWRRASEWPPSKYTSHHYIFSNSSVTSFWPQNKVTTPPQLKIPLPTFPSSFDGTWFSLLPQLYRHWPLIVLQGHPLTQTWEPVYMQFLYSQHPPPSPQVFTVQNISAYMALFQKSHEIMEDAEHFSGLVVALFHPYVNGNYLISCPEPKGLTANTSQCDLSC